jgi:hypothetical protein
MTLTLDLINQEEKDNNITVLTFQCKRSFSAAGAECLSCGMVFECALASCNPERNASRWILGRFRDTDKAQVCKSRRFDITVYCPLPTSHCANETLWVLRPVCMCVSYCRQFDALKSYAEYVPFLKALLGQTPSGSLSAEQELTVLKETCNAHASPVAGKGTVGLGLIDSQKRAMDSFLNSPPNSITIIQGYGVMLVSDCNLLPTNAVIRCFLTKTTWYR